MKKIIYGIQIILAVNTISYARYINGINWADSVASHTDKIQSYSDGGCGGPGSHYMDANTPATTWWVLGESDADGNGDMYAWDFETGDRDYVAGWRGAAAGEEFIVKFEAGIKDVQGDDIVIRMFCGPLAEASVWASVDGENFIQIGNIAGQFNEIPGESGCLYDALFDFYSAFVDDVNFIKVHREVAGSQSGMFFDSLSAAYIDLPVECNEVGLFGWALVGDTDKDGYVNFQDFAVIANHWKKCNDPNQPDFDASLFEDANSIPSNCHGLWQAGMGLNGDINQDCRIDMPDILAFTENYLECNNPEDSNCIANW